MRKTIKRTLTYYHCIVITAAGERTVITLNGTYEKARKELITLLKTDNFILKDIIEMHDTIKMDLRTFIIRGRKQSNENN